MKNLKVTSVKYFETRRGVGYTCKTNVKGVEIYNDGQGGDTYLVAELFEGGFSAKCEWEENDFFFDELQNTY